MYQMPPNNGYNPQYGMPQYPAYQQPMWTPNSPNDWPIPNAPQQPTMTTNTVNQPRPSSLQGRVIGSASEVRPNEVPSNGDPSFFPTQDFSEIYVKTLTTDGTISTTVYRPVPKEAEVEALDEKNPPAYISELTAKIEEISAYLPKVSEELENLKQAMI